MDFSPLWADLAAIARDTAGYRWTLCLCAGLAGFALVGLALVLFALLPGTLYDLWRAIR